MKKIFSSMGSRMQEITSSKRLNIAIIIFALLSVYPWRDGYFFLLDFVSIPEDVYSDRLFWYTGILPAITFVIGDLLGSMVLQYVIYVGALILLGFGSKRVLQQFGVSSWGLRFGVLFAMCNPFIYTRMMEGHANVFLGYALLFMAMSFLLGAVFTIGIGMKRRRGYIVFAGLALSYFPHSVFFILLLTTACFLISGTIWSKIKNYTILTGAILLLNINRIAAGFLTVGKNAVTMTQFDAEHVRAFASQSPDANLPLHLVSLHGFWGENMGRFVNNFVTNDRRHLMFGVIALLVLIGVYVGLSGKYVSAIAYGDQKINIHDSKITAVTLWLILVGSVAYLLSMGTSGRGRVSKLTSAMYEHVPFYTGLREPQKRSGVLLFCYVVLASLGIQCLMKIISYKTSGDMFWQRLIGGVFVTLPLLYTPYMLFAFGGQLGVYTYPDTWYEMKQYVHKVQATKIRDCDDIICYDVLVFPWHQYIKLSRAGNVTANPVERFLRHDGDRSLNILAGDNMEMIDIYTQSSRPASKTIEKYIGPGGVRWSTIDGDVSELQYDAFIQDIQLLGVHTVVVLKEAIRTSYVEYIDLLVDKGYLELGLENEHVLIYDIVQ